MAKKQELAVIFSAETKAFYKALGNVKRATVNASKILAGMAIAGGIFAVKEASAFSKQMAEVNTLLKATPEEMNALKNDAKKLASEMGLSMEDVTKAMYQAVSAGVPKDNLVEFLKTAGQGAIGGVTDMTTAVDGLSSVVNAYGPDVLSAQKANDLFFQAIKGGKTTFPELAANIGRIAPMASSLGIKFKELTASYASLTKQGVNTEMATTQIQGAMTALLKPSTQMEGMLARIAKQQGVADWKSLGFLKTLNLLNKSVDENEKRLADLFPNVRGLNGVLGLTGLKAGIVAEQMTAMNNATGSAGEAFRTMMEDPSKKFDLLKSQFQVIAITLGEKLLPIVSEVAQDFTKWLEDTENVESMIDAMKSMAEVIRFVSVATKELFAFLGTLGEKLGFIIDKTMELASVVGAKFGMKTDRSKERNLIENEMPKVTGMYKNRRTGQLEKATMGADVFAAEQVRQQYGQAFKQMDTKTQQTLIADRLDKLLVELQGQGKSGGLPARAY